MEKLAELYLDHFGGKILNIETLTKAGSNRQYYRITANDDDNVTKSIIGVVGTLEEENQAFCKLDKLFIQNNIKVPDCFAVSNDHSRYLQEDLGMTSLYDLIRVGRENNGNYDKREKSLIASTIAELPRIQMLMNNDDVFNCCYPLKQMDKDSVMFDLNYFKYLYLKLTGIEFNELTLQSDFESLCHSLLNVDEYGFQYRDFQARNVMMKKTDDSKELIPYFIDFQGGRKGPVYYDLASFLWQASSNFSDSLRNEMIDVYLESMSQFKQLDKECFIINLKKFVLFRTLQVLGAYGFRGLWERKKHFIDSIPGALKNLRDLVATGVCDEYPYLKEVAIKIYEQGLKADEKKASVLDLISNDKTYLKNNSDKPLVVKVFSFSYKKGIPQDESGNGGGFIFDCRATHNPGRYEQYKSINGLEKPVIEFLEQDGEILDFLESVYKIVDFHVGRFIERGFTNLFVAFGCTGGQHRSVYSAQHVAEHINDLFGIEVHVCHREQGINSILKARKK